MAVIVPTITAENPHTYREQIERVQGFAKRLHIDLMDGEFTPNKSVLPEQVWLPDDITCDIHIMHKYPLEAVRQLVSLRPQLIIVPAESDYDTQDLKEMCSELGVKFGVALLAGSSVSEFSDKIASTDHVLIFSGNLGHQGGSTADLDLLAKVGEIKQVNPDAEIGWDGGVNDQNIAQIVEAGVSVVNAGGFVHHSDNPQKQYELLASKAQ